MRIASIAWFLGLVALSSAEPYLNPRDYDKKTYFVLHLKRDAVPADIASNLPIHYEAPLGSVPHHHIFWTEKSDEHVVQNQLSENKKRRRKSGDAHVLDNVLSSYKQEPPRQKLFRRVIPPTPPGTGVALPRADNEDMSAVDYRREIQKKLEIKDPEFKSQWHLLNTFQVGHDVNVTQVWLDGITGKNVVVSIVDDGLDMDVKDLKDNYFAKGSYDFNDNVAEPRPRLSDDRHGTRCAGEVAAVRNDACGIGVAYDSKVSGIRILSKVISDMDESKAINYESQSNHIYSCSWGPRDDGRTMEAPGILIRKAMVEAINKGRGGLGSIYVFASGNGAASDDNCNFDGYTNSIYSITVGAVDRKGIHPYYSEECSAQLVVTYSSGSGDSIHTTDVEGKCTSNHGGTSAAAPLAAGIFALVLEVRPDLSWRDMQYLVMDTAVPLSGDEKNQQTTVIGKKFSHVFGYGKIDSYALVERAKNWTLVKPQARWESPWIHTNHTIPEGEKGLVSHFDVTQEMLSSDKANLERVEHVTVTMNLEHTRRGDVSVDLISPGNVTSHIATARRDDTASSGYEDWTFMSVAHWGESGVGTWKLVVRDTKENEHNGTLTDWRFKLWGESFDKAKATPIPLPEEHEDDDHTKITATPTVTTLPPIAPPTTTPGAVPTDHPERPTKPTSTPTPPEEDGKESSWLDKFPIFAASKKVWIIGAASLILVFCIGIGAYFWVARRRRLRNDPRNTYEFDELLNDDEGEGLNAGGEKAGRRRTRGGELYDAFAGGSDDEDFDDYKDRSTERLAAGEEDQYVVGEEESDNDGGGDAESRPLGEAGRL